MVRTIMAVCSALTLVGGCLALGSLDDYAVRSSGAGGTGASMAPGGGAVGGAGGTGGNGGAGGDCTALEPGECAAANDVVQQFTGAGEIVVTDIDHTFGDGVVMVGLFSGTVQLGAAQISATGTDGFIYEVDSDGNYVAHMVLPEADAGSDIQVDFDESNGLVAVGGTYHEMAPGCGAGVGLFARLLTLDTSTNPNTLRSAYLSDLVCLAAVGGTTVRVHDVAMTGDGAGSGWVNLAGAFAGTIGGLTSDGTDGLLMEFDVDGTAGTPLIFGGSGDQVVRAVEENPSNQYLVAGDFSERIEVTIAQNAGGDLSENVQAVGNRDLFVATIDRHPDFGNLKLTAMGGVGATHQLEALSFAPQQTRAVILARMSGNISVGAMAITGPTATDAAILIDFISPYDSDRLFQYVQHIILSAAVLNATLVTQTVGNVIHVAGTARGPITVGDGVTVEPTGCAEDAFILSLNGTSLAGPAQRCGDGTQTLGGLTWLGTTGLAAVIGVPSGSQIDLGEEYLVDGSGADAFLLLQD